MINIDHPMVIYESMDFELVRLDIPKVKIRLAACGEKVVGTGGKRLLLSGLRPYEQVAMEQLVSAYLARRDSFRSIGSI